LFWRKRFYVIFFSLFIIQKKKKTNQKIGGAIFIGNGLLLELEYCIFLNNSAVGKGEETFAYGNDIVCDNSLLECLNNNNIINLCFTSNKPQISGISESSIFEFVDCSLVDKSENDFICKLPYNSSFFSAEDDSEVSYMEAINFPCIWFANENTNEENKEVNNSNEDEYIDICISENCKLNSDVVCLKLVNLCDVFVIDNKLKCADIKNCEEPCELYGKIDCEKWTI
jgi:hypothetical protein